MKIYTDHFCHGMAFRPDLTERFLGKLLFKACAVAALILAVVLVQQDTAHAQAASLVPLAYFDKSDIGPAGGLTEDGQGNFYIVSRGQGPGAIYKLSSAGALTKIYQFDGTLNSLPPFPLTLGKDGNFYGTIGYSTRGIANSGNAIASIFKLTPTGALTILYTFSHDRIPTGPLVLSADSSFFYGTAQSGADPLRIPDPGVYTIFKISYAGEVTTLCNYKTSSITASSDGNLYCTGASPTGIDAIAKVTPNGTVTILATLSHPPNYGGVGFSSKLIQGADGAFYGTTDSGGDNTAGSFYRVTPRGELTTIVNFDRSGQFAPYALVLGKDSNFYSAGAVPGNSAIFRISPAGEVTTLAIFSSYDNVNALTAGTDSSIYGLQNLDRGSQHSGDVFRLAIHPAFFRDEVIMNDNWYYLAFAGGTPFGFYRCLDDPKYLYHVDLGYEYQFDAADAQHGLYLYDFKLNSFLYTSPAMFPYLYDFSTRAFLYYFPDPQQPGRYTTSPRVFYNFGNDQFVFSP